MTKETLVNQLESAKALSSQVDIDKVIELIKQIETPTKITQELVDDMCNKIERCLDTMPMIWLIRITFRFQLVMIIGLK